MQLTKSIFVSKEGKPFLGIIISKGDYTGQILLLLLLNCLQICLTTPKLQQSYISCKMLISEFVPAGRIQLTNTSRGESNHFEVCSSESLFVFVLLKFETQNPKC